MFVIQFVTSSRTFAGTYHLESISLPSGSISFRPCVLPNQYPNTTFGRASGPEIICVDGQLRLFRRRGIRDNLFHQKKDKRRKASDVSDDGRSRHPRWRRRSVYTSFSLVVASNHLSVYCFLLHHAPIGLGHKRLRPSNYIKSVPETRKRHIISS